MNLDLTKWNAFISYCKTRLQNSFVCSPYGTGRAEVGTVVPAELRSFVPRQAPDSFLLFFFNTRLGRAVVYVFAVKDFLLSKIGVLSFFKKTLVFSAFIVASLLGWQIGETLFPGMFCPFAGSLLLGSVSDWFVNRVFYLFNV